MKFRVLLERTSGSLSFLLLLEPLRIPVKVSYIKINYNQAEVTQAKENS